MKPYQRRAIAAYPYYKVATWDGRWMVWRDGKRVFTHRADAERAVSLVSGRYRLSEVTEAGRFDLKSFDVA